jgi:hypothetical protein
MQRWIEDQGSRRNAMSLAQTRTSRSKIIATLLSSLILLASCRKQEEPHEKTQNTFASPDDAAKALVAAAKSGNGDAVLEIFEPGAKGVLSSGDAAKDRADLAGFVSDYDSMHRWRKLQNGSVLLITGTDNKTFPLPLKKNEAGQWYFDVQAGKEELVARRIGRDETAAIDICGAIVQAQQEYYSQHHDRVKQYAQKFISDESKQNGLYWPEASGQSKSPLGPLVAFATADGIKVEPGRHQPFYGYYFAMLDQQGSDAKGGAKSYISNGKMTGGFAVIAYPARYGDSGIITFIVNQSGVLLQKDLGAKTSEVASAITEFNPDDSWTPVEQ